MSGERSPSELLRAAALSSRQREALLYVATDGYWGCPPSSSHTWTSLRRRKLVQRADVRWELTEDGERLARALLGEEQGRTSQGQERIEEENRRG